MTVRERKVRVEAGYGLEGILPDGLCGEILDRYVVPDLKKGDYGSGLYKGTAAIATIIAKNAGVELSHKLGESGSGARQRRGGRGNIAQLLLVLAAIFFFFGASSFFNFGRSRRRGRGIWYGGMGPGGFGGGFGGGGSFGGGFGGGMSGGGGAGRGF